MSGMATPKPDAYLLFVEDSDDSVKKHHFIEHVLAAPLGSKIPFMFDVQWVDSAGEPTKTGRISGTIETLIELQGEEPMVVFSTGEIISLGTFHS